MPRGGSGDAADYCAVNPMSSQDHVSYRAHSDPEGMPYSTSSWTERDWWGLEMASLVKEAPSRGVTGTY